MPIYEYACEHCHSTIEIFQKMNEAPIEVCPECEATGLKKWVSAPAFRLNGKGWYETDFKGEGDTKRNLVTQESEPVSTSKAEANASVASDSGKDTASGKDSVKKETPKASSQEIASESKASAVTTPKTPTPPSTTAKEA